MLDSVTLLIASKDFKVIDPSRFKPNALLVYQSQAIKAVANSTKQDILASNYVPKLTLSHRMNLLGRSDIMLSIEASLPKLIFGNNLEELQAKDLDAVTAALQSKLSYMGIEITTQTLRQADITSVHFSKNIIFRDGTIPFSYIQQMQNSILTSKLDSNRTNYRNAGHSFKWHCNSYEIVIYDKLYDLTKHLQSGPKRSIDSDNFLNLKNIEQQRSKKKKFEALRIEVRLNKRTVIKKLFKALQVTNNLTLQKIFKPSLMRKVLEHYINTIQTKRPAICDIAAMTKQQLLSNLIINNPKFTPRNLLSYVGYSALLQEMTPSEINKLFKPKHQKSLQRLLKELNTIILPSSHNHSFDAIIKQIQQYKPFRLKRIQ